MDREKRLAEYQWSSLSYEELCELIVELESKIDDMRPVDISGTASESQFKLFTDLADFNPSESYGVKAMPRSCGYAYFNKNNKPVTQVYTSPHDIEKNARLIAYMAIGGATEAELVRAIKHSMVLLDARSVPLDIQQSERDNSIAELILKYWQGNIFSIVSYEN